MQIATLSGYKLPRRSMKFRSAKQRANDRAMRSCAIDHRVTSRGFWRCMRGGKRRASR